MIAIASLRITSLGLLAVAYPAASQCYGGCAHVASFSIGHAIFDRF